MTRGWASIACACALGACIGTLTALEISTRFAYGSYMWSIGALIGGIAAYVAIDFGHFCAGIVHSYRQTIAWRPNPFYQTSHYWKAVGMTWVGLASLGSTVALITVVGIFAMMWADTRDFSVTLHSMWEIRGAVIFIGTAFLAVTGMVSFSANKYDTGCSWRENIVAGLRARRTGHMLLVSMNPFHVTIIVLRYGFMTGHALILNIPRFSKAVLTAIVRFVARVFIYVHSYRRTICFVDATIGTAIGFSLGSAIVGAIVGALLGVINYELVSVRWLRIVPASR